MYTSPGLVSFLCGFLNFIWFWFFYFFFLRCTFVTSDLCIVLSLYERRKGKKQNKTQVLPC